MYAYRSETESTLEQVPYATYKSSSGTFYFGLRNVYFSGAGGSFQTYEGCTADYCSPCQKASSPALGLLLTSFFFTLIVTALTILRAVNEKAVFKLVNVVLSFLVVIFSISGFGNWNQICFLALQKLQSDVAHGNGYNIAVVGFFFMIIVFVIHLITPVEGAAQNLDKSDGPSNA